MEKNGIEITRDELRDRFSKMGLVDENAKYGRRYAFGEYCVQVLRAACISELESCESGSFAEEHGMRMLDEIDVTLLHNGNVSSAFLYVGSDYFDKREAVSFNADGFVGLCGWAGSAASEPLLAAFGKWLDWIAKEQRSSKVEVA